MEREQEIERLKQRIAALERAQWRTSRHLAIGLAVAVVVGLAALPPHMIRWAAAGIVVVVALRFWPCILEAIPWQSRKALTPDPHNNSTT